MSSQQEKRNRFVMLYYYDENNKIINEQHAEVEIVLDRKGQKILISPAHPEFDKLLDEPVGAKKGQFVINFAIEKK